MVEAPQAHTAAPHYTVTRVTTQHRRKEKEAKQEQRNYVYSVHGTRSLQ